MCSPTENINERKKTFYSLTNGLKLRAGRRVRVDTTYI